MQQACPMEDIIRRASAIVDPSSSNSITTTATAVILGIIVASYTTFVIGNMDWVTGLQRQRLGDITVAIVVVGHSTESNPLVTISHSLAWVITGSNQNQPLDPFEGSHPFAAAEDT